MIDPNFPVVIYHNPDCRTSRSALAMIQAAGYTPIVVEYLKAGWRRDQLEILTGEAGARSRDWLRATGTPAVELDLLSEDMSDEALMDAMIEHPILVNRPIVVTPKGVKLCRPSEAVFDLLERRPESFAKEDGEIVRRSAPDPNAG